MVLNSEWTIFVAPVLSALLGAIAIRCVEIVSDRRSGVRAIHNELVENFWILDGEVNEIKKKGWSGQFNREVRLDTIEAIKSHSPGVYIRLVDHVDQFPVAITSLRKIHRDQRESQKAGVEIRRTNEEEVVERLREIQETLLEVEENIANYASDSFKRRIMLAKTIERPDFEAIEERETIQKGEISSELKNK